MPILPITNKQSERAYVASLCIVSFLLPWPMKWSNWSLSILALVWVFCVVDISRIQKIFRNRVFWLLVCSYLILVVGLLYTTNYKNGFFLLEKRLMILLFPLIMLSSTPVSGGLAKKVFFSFIASCFAATLYCYAIAWQRYSDMLIATGYKNLTFFTILLPEPIQQHHVYIAMYLVFCICILGYYIINNSSSILYSVVAILLSVYFIVFILFVAAKTALLSLFFITLVMIFYAVKKRIARLYLVVFLLSSIVAAALFYTKIPYISQRLQDLVNVFKMDEMVNNQTNYASTRVAPLKCSLALLKNNWLLGVGTGDLQDEMNKWYIINNVPALIGYDTHNQFFDYILSIGVVGLLCLFITLYYPVYDQIKLNFSMLSILFALLITLSCLTESILNNNKGILFFAFFNTLLITVTKPLTNGTKHG